MTHVFLTGEPGVGKSAALARALSLLGVRAQGLETYGDAPGDDGRRALYLRAYGSRDRGCFLTHVPGGDRDFALPRFDVIGSLLLRRAHTLSPLIVVDELGRLERDARMFAREIGLCLDGDKPVLGVLRLRGAAWADWIRARSDVRVLTVTKENRDGIPEQAAALIRPFLKPLPDTPWAYSPDVRYELEERALARFQTPGERPQARHVRVVVRDGRGRRLLLQRHPHARHDPGVYEAPGGHAQAGESMAEAACRELFEECGIRLFPENLTSLGEKCGPDGREETFLARADAPLTALTLEPDEAVAARWQA